MRSKSSRVTLLVLVLIVVLVAIYTFLVRQPGIGQDGELLPAAEQALQAGAYTTLAGEPVQLESFVGTGVLVVNSWASWCPFCVNELPDFATVANEYADQGVTVIAINRNESMRTANNFIKTLTDIEGIEFWLDERDVFYEQIGGFTMPETLFYTADGDIAVHKRGFMTVEEMREHVESALAATN